MRTPRKDAQPQRSHFSHPVPTLELAASVDLQRVISSIHSSFSSSLSSTLTSALPVYSSNHVDSIVSRKHVLLNELSQSCVQLGAAEHSNKALLSQVDALRSQEMDTKRELLRCREELQDKRDELRDARCGLQDAIATIESLQSELAIVSTSQGAVSLSVQGADAETRLAHECAERERQRKDLALHNVEEYKAYISELTEQLGAQQRTMQAAEEALVTARAEGEREAAGRRRDQASFAEQLAQLRDEQTETRCDIQHEFGLATQRLGVLERERDCLAAECEVLRDLSSGDRATAEGECLRLRECLITQSDWHRTYALQKEEDLAAVRSELAQAQALCDALLQRKEEALRSLGDEHESVQSLQQRLEAMAMELRMGEERLSSAGFEFACVCEERAMLQQRAEDAEAQIADARNRLTALQSVKEQLQQQTLALTTLDLQRQQEMCELQEDTDNYSLQARACRDAVQLKDALLQVRQCPHKLDPIHYSPIF